MCVYFLRFLREIRLWFGYAELKVCVRYFHTESTFYLSQKAQKTQKFEEKSRCIVPFLSLSIEISVVDDEVIEGITNGYSPFFTSMSKCQSQNRSFSFLKTDFDSL